MFKMYHQYTEYIYKYVYYIYIYGHIFVLHSMGMYHSASKLRLTGDFALSSALLYLMKSLKFYGLAFFFLSLCF